MCAYRHPHTRCRVIVSAPSPKAVQGSHLERRKVGIALSAVDEHRQAARALGQLRRQAGRQTRVSGRATPVRCPCGFSAAGPPSRATAQQQLPVCSVVVPCKPPAALKHN